MHRNAQKIGNRDECLPEAEVEEAIATCGGDVRAALRATLIANAYLEAEIERLMRKPPQRVKKI
jgi:hypothetical protein